MQQQMTVRITHGRGWYEALAGSLQRVIPVCLRTFDSPHQEQQFLAVADDLMTRHGIPSRVIVPADTEVIN